MKSLKFASLVLLCATSCLALVLPALGVVAFPDELVNANHSHSHAFEHSHSPDPFTSVATQNQGVNAGNAPVENWGGGASLVQPTVPPPGFPITTSNPPTFSQPGYPPQQSGYPPQPEHGAQDLLSHGGASQKVGTGIWLLLGPVWILSLILWSIAPTPNAKQKQRK